MFNNIITFAPQQFANYIKSKQIYQELVKTPAGMLFVQATDDGIFHASFQEVDVHALHQNISVESVLLVGTPFQLKVWQAALALKKGTTCTYQELAHQIGKPSAFRALANALGANKLAYFVPCHRIVRKNGDLGGYAWGIERKHSLIQSELY